MIKKYIIFFSDLVGALRDVRIEGPTAVRRGNHAILSCLHDLEGDPLYSVKWYKTGQEFYRYTPKENPAKKFFPADGIEVSVSSKTKR